MPTGMTTFSLGASGGDVRFWQQPLSTYCDTAAENVIVIAFLHVFNSASEKLPGMDLSNQCDPSRAFPDSPLLHCPETGVGVKNCQSKGKAVLISLGGAAGAYGFNSDDDARRFAHTIWNLFLGGSSSTRPFDDAVLDGIDLDIEGGPPTGYTAFVTELRALFATDPGRNYYISAAPQCPFPGNTLDSAWIDMVFVQFYNNYCGLQAYGTPNFNFGQWHDWALNRSQNKNVKVYLGVPASRTAANAGYVEPARLREIVRQLRCAYSSFGGVMTWDISQAYGNFDSGQAFSYAIGQQLTISRTDTCGSGQLQAQSPAVLPSKPIVDDNHTAAESMEDKSAEKQKVFVGSVAPSGRGGKHTEHKPPFAIDFMTLEADRSLALFVFDPVIHHGKQLFRMQVRVRTNDHPMSSQWKVSFYVPRGHVVRSTSRGKFWQRGRKVVVVSEPSHEVEKNMVIRFVVEGIVHVKTADPPIDPNDHGFQGTAFDPSLAHFETEPVKDDGR
ncbi:Chitinase 1 [Actinomortierella ambigua]|nr:Chitinase 1 [Actinomortierella ambigua]